jgi:hypothetical protein
LVKIYDPQEGRNWHGPDFAFARSQFEAGLAALGVQVEAGFAKGLALLEDVSVREPHTPAAKKSPASSVITLKPAIGYHFKTGQRDWPKT